MSNFARSMTLPVRALCINGALVALSLALCACVSTPSHYRTVADATLQRDVMQAIGAHEAATGGDRHPVLVSIRPSGQRANHRNGRYTELWVVDSNGRRSTYRVRFAPEPGAGTTFSITRVKSPSLKSD